ncbi:MAG: TIGR04084 family radical SAM/SPASM domain-containing protein [Methanomicrobiales archaeon]|nr:TIGR04084 family radical SAM/SPASM domain-containing protein [Methanomicrobiales archaeon]
MNYHLILTDYCNLCCSYCRGRVGEYDDGAAEAFVLDDDVPLELAYDLDTLASFLAGDPNPSVTFYGGEPLLRPDLITVIMNRIPKVKYLLHTNGTLLHQLPSSVINRIHTMSVSLDGPEALTDRNRGLGTYRTVVNNVRAVREGGFCGEIIARMTVSEGMDIGGAVRHLAGNMDLSFPSIQWQLDADFSRETGGDGFRSWIEGIYNPGIQDLIRWWVDVMRTTGHVLRWYPFLEPLQDMILGRRSLLRCGCGHESYGILTNGAIVPCPLMVGMKNYYIGHIASTQPDELPKYAIRGRCTDCRIRDFCGGRCLYSSVMGNWSEKRKDLICATVFNLHDRLKEVLPEIKDLLENNIIRPHDLDHPRFEGCEIIP